MMVKYKTYCPQATFIMFERSGHNPQVEEPQALFGLMRDFLQR
jgi:proline iminopeptidase